MKFSRTLPAALVSGSLALALALFPSPARAETSAEIQARVNEAYAKLQEYTMELELANGELQTVTAELEETRGQIAQTEEEIERTEEEISRKEREIAQGQQAISDRLSDSYKHGGTSLLDVVLGSSDFDELFSNLFVFPTCFFSRNFRIYKFFNTFTEFILDNFHFLHLNRRIDVALHLFFAHVEFSCHAVD